MEVRAELADARYTKENNMNWHDLASHMGGVAIGVVVVMGYITYIDVSGMTDHSNLSNVVWRA